MGNSNQTVSTRGYVMQERRVKQTRPLEERLAEEPDVSVKRPNCSLMDLYAMLPYVGLATLRPARVSTIG